LEVPPPPQPLVAPELEQKIQQLIDKLDEIYRPRWARQETVLEPLRLALDLRGSAFRNIAEVYVKSSIATTFVVEDSVNGVDWHKIDEITVTANGEESRRYRIQRPVIRVTTTAVADNIIEISSS